MEATTAPPELDGKQEQEEFEPEYDLLGTQGQLSLNVGGKRPTNSSLKLVGGKLDIEGEFRKGDRLRIYAEIEVGEVAFRDKHDSRTGDVVSCDRAHKARIVGVERVNDEPLLGGER